MATGGRVTEWCDGTAFHQIYVGVGTGRGFVFMAGDQAVLDAESDSEASSSAPAFRYVDLFAGIGGFHAALKALGGQCVYVSEIDDRARRVYELNWGADLGAAGSIPDVLRGDINVDAPQDGGTVAVPEHDVLAAGFPCQSFSKSGAQRGVRDKTRGTLFFNILRILETRRPKIVFLENVRNLAGPRHADTWQTIIESLESLDYEVASAPMVVSPHFLPPEVGGAPQVRERVYILGIHRGAHRVPSAEVDPTFVRGPVAGWDPQLWDLEATPLPWLGGRPLLQPDAEIEDVERYRLTAAEVRWIDAWDNLVVRMRRAGAPLPGHPLWADHFVLPSTLEEDDLAQLPDWKADFIRKNAAFYAKNRAIIEAWRADPAMGDFELFPESRRKFEWQAQEAATLWDCIMHLRPSGIRAKRATYVPALVAITQTSIIGKRRRRITPIEAARLQGLPDTFSFGDQPEAETYKQLGNGVNAGAVHYAVRRFVERYADDLRPVLPGLVEAVVGADASTWPVIVPAPRVEVPEDALDLGETLAIVGC